MSSLLDARALWRVFVDASERRPDGVLTERDDWVQLRTPSSRQAVHNRVMHARLPRGEAEERIGKIRADHAARGAALGWLIGLGSAPLDLAERLQAMGIPPRALLRGMAREVPSYPSKAPRSPSMRRARKGDADRIATLSARAWGRGEDYRNYMRDFAARELEDPHSRVSFWLAAIDGEPVGSAILRHLSGRLGYLQGACVLEAHRGRGIYTALTRARLGELSRAGAGAVVVWADAATTAPIVERLGFREVGVAHYHEQSRWIVGKADEPRLGFTNSCT